MLLIFLLLFVACSTKPDFYDKALIEYMNDIKIVSFANELYNDEKKERQVEKAFYNTIFCMDTTKINANNNGCDKECYLKLAKLEAIMLLVQNMASNDSMPFTSKPFYKWKDIVVRGENVSVDDLYKQLTPPSTD